MEHADILIPTAEKGSTCVAAWFILLVRVSRSIIVLVYLPDKTLAAEVLTIIFPRAGFHKHSLGERGL